MSKWGGTYTVGTSSPRDFPMAIFAKAGGPASIVFTLNATSAAGAHPLRIQGRASGAEDRRVDGDLVEDAQRPQFPGHHKRRVPGIWRGV
jgi:hypothetical protein